MLRFHLLGWSELDGINREAVWTLSHWVLHSFAAKEVTSLSWQIPKYSWSCGSMRPTKLQSRDYCGSLIKTRMPCKRWWTENPVSPRRGELSSFLDLWRYLRRWQGGKRPRTVAGRVADGNTNQSTEWVYRQSNLIQRTPIMHISLCLVLCCFTKLLSVLFMIIY